MVNVLTVNDLGGGAEEVQNGYTSQQEKPNLGRKVLLPSG